MNKMLIGAGIVLVVALGMFLVGRWTCSSGGQVTAASDRDSLILIEAQARGDAERAAHIADSLRAVLDSAGKVRQPDTVYIMRGIRTMRYAPVSALRDTLLVR